MAELLDQQLGGIDVDRLIDRRHGAHIHERLDDLGAAHRHAVGQLLHGNGLGYDDFAHYLDRLALLARRRAALYLLALARPAHGCQASDAILLDERLTHGQFAGTPAGLPASRRE